MAQRGATPCRGNTPTQSTMAPPAVPRLLYIHGRGCCRCFLRLMFVNHRLNCRLRSIVTQSDPHWVLHAGLAPEDYWLERQAESLRSIH
jgi:hypothetical protein